MCVYYLIRFKKKEVQALINSGSEVNVIIPAYTLKLGFWARKPNVGAQKIDGSTFQLFKMILASFQIEDKLGKTQFFQETFLLADTSVKVILSICFLILSNANI